MVRVRRVVVGVAICVFGVLMGGVCVPAAVGQEAINTPAATQPGEGSVVYQTRARAIRFGEDPTGSDREVTDLRWEQRLQYGLSGRDSVQLDFSYVWRSYEGAAAGAGDTEGFDDLKLTYKRRVWERDLGPVDTVRLSVFGGAEFPTGSDDFSSDSVDPLGGATLLAILGRHGFNQSVAYTLTTGDTNGRIGPGSSTSDAVYVDSAYLFRLAPAEYGEEYAGSWYALVELNAVVETNGDSEGLLSPGLLYEGTTWAAEVGVRIPVWSDVSERLEREWGLSLGVRFLF